MRYLIILFLSIFILSCTNTNNSEEAGGIGEAKTERANPIVKEDNRTDEEVIKDIKKQYQIVTEGKGKQQFKIDSLFYECADYPEIGEIIYYTDELGVWLIEHSCTQGDHGGRTDQYFLWEGELFFLYSDESYWTFGGGFEDKEERQPSTIDYFTEKRYYFHKDKALKCLEKKYELRSSKKNNPKSENVHNVEIEAKDTEKRLKNFNQLLSLVGEENLEGNCIWEF